MILALIGTIHNYSKSYEIGGNVWDTGTSRLGYLVSRGAWLAAGLIICSLSIKLAMRMG